MPRFPPPLQQNAVERDRAFIHDHLNEMEFNKVAAEGSTMTLEQAIALALEESYARQSV